MTIRANRQELEIVVGKLANSLILPPNVSFHLEGHNPGGERIYELQLLRNKSEILSILGPAGCVANGRTMFAYLQGMVDAVEELRYSPYLKLRQ